MIEVYRYVVVATKLTDEQFAEVRAIAHGMSEQEVADYFMIDLEELSEAERKKFIMNYKKGKADFIHFAVSKLKDSMSGKDGYKASLAALGKSAEEWPEDSESFSKENGFTFKVVKQASNG